jgi:hypothetical protein
MFPHQLPEASITVFKSGNEKLRRISSGWKVIGKSTGCNRTTYKEWWLNSSCFQWFEYLIFISLSLSLSLSLSSLWVLYCMPNQWVLMIFSLSYCPMRFNLKANDLCMSRSCAIRIFFLWWLVISGRTKNRINIFNLVFDKN